MDDQTLTGRWFCWFGDWAVMPNRPFAFTMRGDPILWLISWSQHLGAWAHPKCALKCCPLPKFFFFYICQRFIVWDSAGRLCLFSIMKLPFYSENIEEEEFFFLLLYIQSLILGWAKAFSWNSPFTLRMYKKKNICFSCILKLPLYPEHVEEEK